MEIKKTEKASLENKRLIFAEDDVTVDLDFQSLDDTDVPVDIQEYVRQEVVEDDVEEEALPFVTVEQKPTFNGGDANDFAKWEPGRQRDRAVKVSYTFPVIYRLR